MSRKQFHLTLFQKALILVAVPLAFELTLLASLNGLLNQAEREAEQAEHAKLVIARTKDVIQLFFDVGVAFVVYDAATKPILERRFSQLYHRVPGELDALRDLVKDNPKYLAIVNRVSAGAKEAMATLAESKLVVEAGGRFNLIEAFRLKQNLGKLVEELNVIIRDEESSRMKNPEAAPRLKAMVKQLLAFGVVMSILIALLLVAVFHRGTAQRLRTLIDNSTRLGRREELTPLLQGDDEIARLDKVFHEAATALTEAARKERAVIDNAVDVICSIDANGEFTAVSPASIKLWGYAPEEMLGRNWVELVAPEDAEGSLQWVAKMRAGQQPSPLENRLKRKDGTVVDMLWSSHWSTKEQSLFSVAHDVTERRELERFKQQFVQMISHDLRTPLMAVQSTLALLSNDAWGQLSDKAHLKVGSAETNIRHTIDLINNLLELEKMESGKMELQLSVTPLKPLLDRCAQAVAPLAETRSIIIDLPDTDVAVLAEQGRLSQVVINFLGNALKFSPEDSRIAVTVEAAPPWVKVSVADRGPGIPDAQKELIFERYHQIPAAGERKILGTGLGLAICKAIVEAHGGTIGVDSQEGEGSTFWFRISSAH